MEKLVFDVHLHVVESDFRVTQTIPEALVPFHKDMRPEETALSVLLCFGIDKVVPSLRGQLVGVVNVGQELVLFPFVTSEDDREVITSTVMALVINLWILYENTKINSL